MKKTYTSAGATQFVLWAGTESSFEQYLDAMARGRAMEAGGRVVHQGDDEEDDEDKMLSSASSNDPKQSPLLDIQGGVGMISVKGILTNEDNWWNSYAGLVSYNEIRTALYQAMISPSVKEIMMDVSSPGGMVYGVLDAVAAVDAANKAKRVTAYTDSVAASAGFWIVAPAKKRFASPVATVGSIGVVAKHVEHSAAAKDAGYTETIIRSGKYKQIANSSEPLSKAAHEVLQGQVDHMAGVFSQSVADYLGTTQAIVENTMGAGREYIGTQAVEAGLIDGVMSFDEVFSTIQNRVAKSNVGGMPQGGPDMKKKYAMSEATALAAAAAGVDLTVPDQAVTDPEQKVEGAPTAETTTEAPQDEAGVTPGAEAAPVVPEATIDPVVTMLKSQLKEKDEELFTAKTELQGLRSSLEGLGKLKEIVAQSINTMLVSMSGSADPSLATATSESLLAQHEATKTRFLAQWANVVPGGTASAAEDAPETAKAPTLSRSEQARLNAASTKIVPLRQAAR